MWGPLILCLSSQRRGGGGGGGGGAEESFPVRFLNVTFQFTELLQISLLICDVSPFLDQVFRCFFSMNNLRGYGEDETSSSSCLGPSSKELPSPSAGSAPPLRIQAAVMAGTPSSVVPVTSGLVPQVSARSRSSLPGSQDCEPLPRQPWWPPSSSPGRALWGLPGPCRAWPVGLFESSHAAYRCGPSMCVGDDDDNWKSSPYALPHIWGLLLNASKTKFKPPGSGCRCQRPSTRLLLHPGRAQTGFRHNHFSCQSVPACYAASCLSRTSRTYRTLPRILPRRPYTCTQHLPFLLFQTLKCTLLPTTTTPTPPLPPYPPPAIPALPDTKMHSPTPPPPTSPPSLIPPHPTPPPHPHPSPTHPPTLPHPLPHPTPPPTHPSPPHPPLPPTTHPQTSGLGQAPPSVSWLLLPDQTPVCSRQALTVGQSPCSPWVQLLWRSWAISAGSPSSEITLTFTTSPWSFTLIFISSPQVPG